VEQGMQIVHHVSHAELDRLFAAVAKPVEHDGALDWIAPAWWYLMWATATH
jgi:hypothetical protein